MQGGKRLRLQPPRLQARFIGHVAAPPFVLDGPAEHGLPGLAHLFEIESPGLTCAPSLAEDVADRIAA